MSFRSHVPNTITLLNLFSGCIACVFAFQSDYLWAGFFVCLGIFFDFFDGFFARLLNVKSDLGLQLDSLADMVTSGLVPGIIMFQILGSALNPDFSLVNFDFLTIDSVALIGFSITLASAYRLANFNIDQQQTESFIGLPTPGNAIFVISSGILLEQLQLTYSSLILILLCVISCYLLNAKLSLFSFKFSSYDFASNWYRYILIIGSIAALLMFELVAVPFIVVGYILSSVFLNLRSS